MILKMKWFLNLCFLMISIMMIELFRCALSGSLNIGVAIGFKISYMFSYDIISLVSLCSLWLVGFISFLLFIIIVYEFLFFHIELSKVCREVKE